jgi:hypothetical protein
MRHYHYIPKSCWSNLSRFFLDLTRWRPHIEHEYPEDLHVFDEFVQILWGKPLPSFSQAFEAQNNLAPFRELLTNILSTVVVPCAPSDFLPTVDGLVAPVAEQNTHRLSALEISKPFGQSQERGMPEAQSVFFGNLEPAVVLLTGTVVFGAVLAFILCKYTVKLNYEGFYLRVV